MRVRAFACILLVLVASIALPAQTPDLEPSRENNPVQVVVFDFVHNGLTPSHYVIAIQSTGRATYTSDNPGGESQGENYTVQFTASEETRRKVFDLARQADRFQKNCEAKNKVAFTGTKTLTYLAGPAALDIAAPITGVRTQCTFNFSLDPAVQQLTATFQGIAATIEFGSRLSQKLRYDKLGLHDEMKRMEESWQRGLLLEVQAVEPVLREVANGRGVVKTARDRATKMLRQAEAR